MVIPARRTIGVIPRRRYKLVQSGNNIIYFPLSLSSPLPSGNFDRRREGGREDTNSSLLIAMGDYPTRRFWLSGQSPLLADDVSSVIFSLLPSILKDCRPFVLSNQKSDDPRKCQVAGSLSVPRGAKHLQSSLRVCSFLSQCLCVCKLAHTLGAVLCKPPEERRRDREAEEEKRLFLGVFSIFNLLPRPQRLFLFFGTKRGGFRKSTGSLSFCYNLFFLSGPEILIPIQRCDAFGVRGFFLPFADRRAG